MVIEQQRFAGSELNRLPLPWMRRLEVNSSDMKRAYFSATQCQQPAIRTDGI